ncbi:FAD/NAD(P)-binding domain-containing protein [Hyaloscypha variabilis F]|uniref:FAD/NAD(P)-binding domain-containing protein n=1 Tax=Hyaloscypha variabilis (strain UAMH 11265 / GT02V1 / F) TaxID=1149755 RepID=A0A2J6SDM4_HYAVF|nr:FAD/NAD(P)-binding domain-containing protein [Hyaloscypha variabilis F]
MTINNTGSEKAGTREIPVTTSSDAPATEKRFAPHSGFVIEDRPLDDYAKLRVAVIGAGISGINTGILFPVKVPNIDLTIFEKNSDVGGTWLENIYPGVRCDIPAHVYQSTFAPNTQWSQEYAEGAEIGKYWQDVAKKYDVYKYIKFQKRIVRATWDPEASEWVLQIKDLKSGETQEQRFDVLVPAIGVFNAWKLPDYPGINEYEGHIRHSSNWDPNFDPAGKTIAVIGNGASGLQITPPLQKVAKHLDVYVRNPTWIAPSFGQEKRSETPVLYTEERKQAFQDPKTYHSFRKPFESQFWRNFHRIFKDSKGNNEAKEAFTKLMTSQLEKKPQSFWRKYFRISSRSADDRRLAPDTLLLSPRITSPYAYFGIAPPLFPNLFFSTGPNCFGLSGTFPFTIETVVTYIAKVLRKIQTNGLKTIVVSEGAADDFIEYIDRFFERTVLSGNCSSWYNGGKAGQRIHGPWPGSASHATKVRVEPRWEDFEYTYKSKQKNRFAFFWEWVDDE